MKNYFPFSDDFLGKIYAISPNLYDKKILEEIAKKYKHFYKSSYLDMCKEISKFGNNLSKY